MERAQRAEAAGVARAHIVLDPGLGFSKTVAHNLALLRHTDRRVALGYPVLIGPSRTRFSGQLVGDKPPEDRVFGTAATVAAAILGGAHILRVHDVAQMVDVARVAHAIRVA